MKNFIKSVVVLTAAFAACVAQAGVVLVTSDSELGTNDSIDWAQLGPQYTVLTGPLAVSSQGGLAATVSTTGGPLERRNQGTSWAGNFHSGDPVLWQKSGADITLTFASAVFGVGAQIQNDFYGPFTARIMGIGGEVLGTFSQQGVSNSNNDGSAIFIGMLSDTQNISSVVFSVDSNDFAIGNVSLNTQEALPGEVPEPFSVALLGLGSLGMALARRSQRKQA